MPEETRPVVLVTGASRGLGRGIAVRCAELGMSVAVNYAGDATAAAATSELCRSKALHRDQAFLPIQGDVSVAEGRERIFGETIRQLGRIDALVNNAGIGPKARVDITETTPESFTHVLRTNLEGPFFLTQRVVNYWLKGGPAPLLPNGFAVIFNSSISADTASPNRVEYCISKAGVAMAAQTWAVRLAVDRINVYELRPGIMLTDMTSGVKEKYDRMFAEGGVPQRRWGTPEDVGRAVGSLLTGDFPYSTGAVIHIDGGFHLRRL